jgi:hypothetical protein
MIEKLEYFKDPNFKFDPAAHSYTYIDPLTQKPVQIFESVSGFIEQFKKPFDPNTHKYVAKARGVDPDELLKEWKQAGDLGKNIGTIAHDWIENFYDDPNLPLPEDPEVVLRINQFKKIYDEKLYKFKSISRELRMFSRKWGIAGTLDNLLELGGKYYVGDYKTNKDFKDEDHPKGKRNRLLYPFDNHWQNDITGYSLQLSTYRLMLEEVGFKTHGAFIISIGPNSAKIYKALDFTDKLKFHLLENNYSF